VLFIENSVSQRQNLRSW